jgi:8-oxo-dGTP pyrophosphatase MutT (NUDIX family)
MPAEPVIQQAAAIPVLAGNVCLIMSSSRRRWIVPKGCIDPGDDAAGTAEREAWEEAGLRGVLHSAPVGTYHYRKFGNTYHVTVFLLEVTEAANDWPEARWRQRQWLPCERAVRLVGEPALRSLLGHLTTVGATHVSR